MVESSVPSPLTNFSAGPSDKTKIADAIVASLIFLAICWGVYFWQHVLGHPMRAWGLEPRTLDGIPGILSMHFIHGGWEHITQNSLAFLVLNSFLFYFYRPIALRTFLLILLGSGVLLWFIGRPSVHLGASMIIYGEFAFLLLSGIIRRNPPLMRVALVITLYYGSLIWYIFPIEEHISWEGHLSGLIIGSLSALLWRNLGPQRKVYRFETEPDPDDSNPYWMEGHDKRDP